MFHKLFKENLLVESMKLVFTPDWFLTPDVFIEFFSFVVLVLFFIYSVRNYKLTKNRGALYLGLGFLLIAVAELSTIATKLVLYYDSIFTRQLGDDIISYHLVNSVDIFYYIGFFFHKLLTLLGLYTIYRISSKRSSAGDVFLTICFIVIASLFSNAFYYVFHIVALILLCLIINNYYDLYKKNKFRNTKVLLGAFSMLALSQVIMILSKLQMLYVLAQIVQLISYIILLILIIIILNHGERKKKKQN